MTVGLLKQGCDGIFNWSARHWSGGDGDVYAEADVVSRSIDVSSKMSVSKTASQNTPAEFLQLPTSTSSVFIVAGCVSTMALYAEERQTRLWSALPRAVRAEELYASLYTVFPSWEKKWNCWRRRNILVFNRKDLRHRCCLQEETEQTIFLEKA